MCGKIRRVRVARQRKIFHFFFKFSDQFHFFFHLNIYETFQTNFIFFIWTFMKLFKQISFFFIWKFIFQLFHFFKIFSFFQIFQFFSNFQISNWKLTIYISTYSFQKFRCKIITSGSLITINMQNISFYAVCNTRNIHFCPFFLGPVISGFHNAIPHAFHDAVGVWMVMNGRRITFRPANENQTVLSFNFLN